MTAKQALDRWALTAPVMVLAAHRENKVYRVEATEGTFALRYHRPGYRTDAELLSELQWMEHELVQESSPSLLSLTGERALDR